MATVKDKLDINIHGINERCDRVKELVGKYAEIQQPNYGHVGDLVYISDELVELIQFLERAERCRTPS